MSIQFDIAKQIIAETCPNRKLKLENIRLFADIIQPKKYQKGDIILNEGDICNCLFYIEKGFIRQHYLRHDKDVIAVNQQSQIVGFSSITPHGYLHSMFVHKDFQGKGIATMLLEEIERYAITAGIMRITSEVSLTARPFFEKKGYVVEEEQKRKANQLSLTNFWMAREVTKIQRYEGRIPACGVFCGGCPTYTREKNPCKGAELNSSRCEKCKTFHLCCLEKEITHCFQCSSFPCARFKGFTKRWLKYGQNFIENQKLLSEIGEVAFLEYYNKKVTD